MKMQIKLKRLPMVKDIQYPTNNVRILASGTVDATKQHNPSWRTMYNGNDKSFSGTGSFT